MKLKKLEIAGFKSFLEKAVLKFPEGVSAIVGPNGCGKSNVVDALRWVMGEQSVKQLRGKSTEDIIFAGTNGRAKSNVAEVSLTLENDNTGPDSIKEYSEVMITRRVYRSGETAYFLNKQPCRLKDIHNIFLGSGMGSRSFAVIQQGNIGAITDAGPNERRLFIEEAAGITKFKARKKETLKKIEATQDNILRVNDIILEIEQRMSALTVQAKNAEKYKNYQDTIRRLDLMSAVFYHDYYSVQIEETEKILTGFSSNEVEFTSKIFKSESVIETIKLNILNRNQEIDKSRKNLFELQRKIDNSENNLEHFKTEIKRLSEEITASEKSITEIEKKNESLQDEIKESKNKTSSSEDEIKLIEDKLSAELAKLSLIEKEQKRLNDDAETENFQLIRGTKKEAEITNTIKNTETKISDIERRLKIIDEEVISSSKNLTERENTAKKYNDELLDIDEEIEQLDDDIELYRKKHAGLSKDLENSQEQLRNIELENNRIQSKHTTLKKMEDNHEWYRDGVKAVKKRMKEHYKLKPSDKPLIADILTAEPGFENALEAALGESIQYFVIEDSDEGKDLIEYLRKFSKGRSGFIPLATFKSSDLNYHDNGFDLLINHVDIKKGFSEITESIIGNIIFANDLNEATQIWLETNIPVVTQAGDFITENGILTGGSKDKLLGVLAKKKEIKDLEKRIKTLSKDYDENSKKHDDISENINKEKKDLDKTIKYKEESLKERVDVEKSILKINEELKHNKDLATKLKTEQENLEIEIENILEEKEKNELKINDVLESVKTSKLKIENITNEITEITQKASGHNKEVMDLKLKLTTLKTQSESSTTALKRLEDFLKDGLLQLEREIALKSKNSEKKDKTEDDIVNFEKTLVESHKNYKVLSEKLVESEEEYKKTEEELRINEKELSKLSKEKDETVGKIRFHELEQSQRKMKKENVAARVLERYHSKIETFESEFRVELENDKIEKQEDLEKIEDNLSKLKKRLNKLGDVNLGAINEYEEVKERSDFLNSQKEDLEKSIQDMEEIIKKINKVSQEKFIAIFNEINIKMSEVFPTLFDGGKAELIMTEPSKPLETGVELMIQPPGKKVSRLSLLSGGEKALSAIAFVFSIFLIKPASFCILDEIDAPLDDANVYRFNKLLKIIGERSQILMITHNKTTMEFADILFGVTMEKKGISKVVSVNFEKNRG
ncbi:MAG: chromosome segregation protein SMC [Deltaproteobacteria bacterium]|nr:chromosome segregation protein SMC [Deltaproteobacteria bacterium]